MSDLVNKKQWLIKEFSLLTKVSVRTLHHYDQIDLLKPSVRLPNGYRVYSITDLMRLQQILALKFFGFELSRIQEFLSGKVETLQFLRMQQLFLSEKINSLKNAENALSDLIKNFERNNALDLLTTIKLMEKYQMIEELEKSWAGKVFNKEELKDYADFQESLKQRFTLEDKKNHENEWATIITDIAANLDQDPRSEFGYGLGKRCMDFVNKVYGREYTHLRMTMWEKGFLQGKTDPEHSVDPKVLIWLDNAVEHYYRTRIYDVLNQVGKLPEADILKSWEEIADDMYGNATDRKKDLVKLALANNKISQKAKDWLVAIS